MARRRFLIGLLMLAVILGAAGLVGYLYIDAREELLARADDNLGDIARDAATRAKDLFEPARMVILQIADARLDRDDPATAQRRFFGIARTTLALAPQISGVTLARPDGSALLIQNLPPRQLIDDRVLTDAYKGFVRRIINWDHAHVRDAWSYWDPGSREWVDTNVIVRPAGPPMVRRGAAERACGLEPALCLLRQRFRRHHACDAAARALGSALGCDRRGFRALQLVIADS
jgi:hypothetical protein